MKSKTSRGKRGRTKGKKQVGGGSKRKIRMRGKGEKMKSRKKAEKEE